jgi:GNAT superfamily N-acetyltransferase
VCSTLVKSLFWADRSKPKRAWARLVDDMLDHPLCALHLACDGDAPDRLFGFCISFRIPVVRALGYVYVSKGQRKHGYARQLVTKALPGAKPLVYCLRGPDASDLLQRYRDAVFVPFEKLLDLHVTSH